MEKKEVIYNFQQAEPDDFGPSKLEEKLNTKLKELCKTFALDMYVLNDRMLRPQYNHRPKCVIKTSVNR